MGTVFAYLFTRSAEMTATNLAQQSCRRTAGEDGGGEPHDEVQASAANLLAKLSFLTLFELKRAVDKCSMAEKQVHLEKMEEELRTAKVVLGDTFTNAIEILTQDVKLFSPSNNIDLTMAQLCVVVNTVVNMADMKLSPRIIVLLDKAFHVFADAHDHLGMVTGIQLVSRGFHWIMYFRVKGLNAENYGALELNCEKPIFTDANGWQRDFTPQIAALHDYNYVVKLTSDYIIPNLRVGELRKFTTCQIPWIRLLVACSMDEQIFQEYNVVTNNCQHFVERIFKRLGLRATRTPTLLPDLVADPLRPSSGGLT